jgi:hypothetical protein
MTRSGRTSIQPKRPFSGRRAVAALAFAWVKGASARAQNRSVALPFEAQLLLPGAEETGPVWIGRQIAQYLARGPGAASPIRVETESVGGADGITAANRFATVVRPDGRTLLLLPGAACHARLVGDRRAKFDPGRWVPICAVEAPALLVARTPMRATSNAEPLRLALVAPEQPATAALFALDLLGIAARPIFGLSSSEAEAALLQQQVDALVLRTTDAESRLPTLGAQAWFALGAAETATTPSIAELLDASVALPARRALLAACAATRLLGVLLLPSLTTAALVTYWRASAQRWVEDRIRLGPASPWPGFGGSARALSGVDAATHWAALAAPADSQKLYQDWLSQRLRWRPA